MRAHVRLEASDNSWRNRRDSCTVDALAPRTSCTVAHCDDAAGSDAPDDGPARAQTGRCVRRSLARCAPIRGATSETTTADPLAIAASPHSRRARARRQKNLRSVTDSNRPPAIPEKSSALRRRALSAPSRERSSRCTARPPKHVRDRPRPQLTAIARSWRRLAGLVWIAWGIAAEPAARITSIYRVRDLPLLAADPESTLRRPGGLAVCPHTRALHNSPLLHRGSVRESSPLVHHLCAHLCVHLCASSASRSRKAAMSTRSVMRCRSRRRACAPPYNPLRHSPHWPQSGLRLLRY